MASCRSWVTNRTVRLLPLPHFEEQLLQQQPGLAVERAERFVHQQDIRARSQMCAPPRRAGACPARARGDSAPRTGRARRLRSQSRAISRRFATPRTSRPKATFCDRRAPGHHAVAREHVADVVADAGDGAAIDLGLALCSAGRRPETTLRSVDLPQPDGPTMVTIAPSGTSKLKSPHGDHRRAIARTKHDGRHRPDGSWPATADMARSQALVSDGFQRSSRASILRMTALNSQASHRERDQAGEHARRVEARGARGDDDNPARDWRRESPPRSPRAANR